MPVPGPVREGRDAARLLRAEHGLGDGPLPDLFSALERLFDGLLVHIRPLENGPVGALLHAGRRWVAVVNSAEAALARQRFTAAHEAGHFHFERALQSVVVDETMSYQGNAREQRANAFAVNLILPIPMLRQRIAEKVLDPTDVEHVVRLAMEYGLSYESTIWHLKNNNLISEAQRRALSGQQPYRVAAQLGLREQLQLENRARNCVRWPPAFLSQIREAQDANLLDKGWLEDDQLPLNIPKEFLLRVQVDSDALDHLADQVAQALRGHP